MGHLLEIVDSLENKIGELLNTFQLEKKQKLKLEEDVDVLNKKLLETQEFNLKLQNELESLKLANSILGSDQHKRETKLKINALVREIDQCITQLSE